MTRFSSKVQLVVTLAKLSRPGGARSAIHRRVLGC